ncbi:MAG TPA: ricin-type beta-trefoil lectin domain protein, partial [Longimicrobiaceae bacterium]|nr:ricin-type beta-trefoil lectin domain protein [Longimicrobiaceae bacterium]
MRVDWPTPVLAALAAALLCALAAATPASAQQIFAASSNSRLCLALSNARAPDGTTLRVESCNGSPAQQFVLQKDGMMQALGGHGRPGDGRQMCVDHWPDYASGAAVKVWPCRPSMPNDPQRWRRTTEGQLVSSAHQNGALCMAAHGSSVVIDRCSAVPSQIFNPRDARKPIMVRVEPSGAIPLGGTLTVVGENLDVGQIDFVLKSRDPSARTSSWNRTRYITNRSASRVQMSLGEVPAGSYTLQMVYVDGNNDIHDQDLTTPVVVDRPTRMGPPAIRAVQSPVNAGSRLVVRGENFADDARIMIGAATGGGSARALTLAEPPTRSRIVGTLPTDLQPGKYVIRVDNPRDGTHSSVESTLVLRPGQDAGGWQQEQRAAARADSIQKAHRLAVRQRRDERRRRHDARKKRSGGSAPGEFTGGSTPAVPAAAAKYDVASTIGSLCLVPQGDYTNAEVRLEPCDQGGAMYRIENGYVVTASGRCLDWGDEGGPIHLYPCKKGRPARSSQQWLFATNKLVQNLLHDDV